jgi:transcriptional regulator with XRE-family HTH domain
MSNITTGRQLRAARILAGLTQKQLAQAVGVHERRPLLGTEGRQSTDIDTEFAHKDRGRIARSRCDRICNTDRRCAACH